MTRRIWILVAMLCVVACLVAAGAGGAWLLHNVPGIARLVYGDPASVTPLPTARPTFTPLLSTATLTSTPTPSPSPTWTPSATPVPPSTLTDAPPTETPTSLPSPTATPEPPTPTALPPTPTPQPEWIAFETKRGELGDYEIFVVASDGSRLANLTHSWADDLAPVWSPDGRRIAFVSLRDTLAGKWDLGPGSIYLMDFDPSTGAGGGNVVRLTDAEGSDGWPTWSPDSQRVAFESDRSGNWDIWIINVDGSGLVNLTRSPEEERFPAWSPDGKKMAFTSKRSGNYDVWLLDVEGALQGPEAVKPLNLTKVPARDRYAMWSPDGKKIAFNTGRDGNQEIYVMNANGSNPTNVTNAPDSIEGLADWSPSGERLVLYSDRPGNKDVFVVDLVSGRWTNITQHPVSDEFCTWAP